MQQLLLDLLPPSPPSLTNFVVGDNAAALTALAGWLLPESREPALLLWGEHGSGKSHLLCAAQGHYADAASDPSLAALAAAEPGTAPLLAIDNVDQLDEAGQISLFNLFNRYRAAGGKLLLAAYNPPTALTHLREDLRTRLGSALIFRLAALSDAHKTAALASQASERGLTLTDEAIAYLLRHAPRDMRSLSALIAALDRFSLERQRPLTLPLLREVLLHTHATETAA